MVYYGVAGKEVLPSELCMISDGAWMLQEVSHYLFDP